LKRQPLEKAWHPDNASTGQVDPDASKGGVCEHTRDCAGSKPDDQPIKQLSTTSPVAFKLPSSSCVLEGQEVGLARRRREEICSEPAGGSTLPGIIQRQAPCR
jgi:hypothetical protein